MFKTFQGVTEDSKSEIYLRPETAQGIFVNFRNCLLYTSFVIKEIFEGRLLIEGKIQGIEFFSSSNKDKD